MPATPKAIGLVTSNRQIYRRSKASSRATPADSRDWNCLPGCRKSYRNLHLRRFLLRLFSVAKPAKAAMLELVHLPRDPASILVFPLQVPPMNVELIANTQGGRAKKLRLHREMTVVGRRRDCNLCIPSSEVSRRHCLLHFQDGYLTVEDLKSINGTFLNDQQIAEKSVVYPGDRLTIGPVHFTVRYELTPEARVRLNVPEAVEGNEFQFEVVPVEDAAEELPTIKMDPEEPAAAVQEFEIVEDVNDSQVLEIVDDPELVEIVEDAEIVEEIEDAQIVEILEEAQAVEDPGQNRPPKKNR
jgi:pSer/pThr/pTyr-binding forkhead associated (FHA) protein